MALIELEYEERADGLLYPILEIADNSRLDQLGKFGEARLEYIHEKHFEYYRELLFTGKLADHCEDYDNRGYKLSEKLQQEYLSKQDIPLDDTMERIKIFTQARDWAEEVVIQEMLCNSF